MLNELKLKNGKNNKRVKIKAENVRTIMSNALKLKMVETITFPN
jgi:hypothetical protein